jgi:hypothetical protein
VAVGEGAVWAQSVDGELLKANPETNEVTATVSVGEWPSQLAVYGGGVWSKPRCPENARNPGGRQQRHWDSGSCG